MLYENNYIEKLIGIKGVILKNIEENNTSITLSFKLEVKDHKCPCCGNITRKVHDYRTQIIKEAPMFGKHTYFKFRKRRYVCNNCNKRFYEKVSFVPRYHRMTSRLVSLIVEKMRSTHSMSSIADECNVSVHTITRVFNYVNYSFKHMPSVLSIDEFKGNAGKKKYQCIITDPKNKKVLDVLEGREQHILTEYFKDFKDRKNVKYFVMDMWKPYKDLAETFFKNSTIVIDKYHFIRQVIWAFERVRKSEQKKFASVRRKYFKRSRFLLLKRMKKLNEEELQAVEVMLKTSPKLNDAYMLKEKFYEFIDSPDLESAKRNLKAWYLFVGTCNVPEFDECVKTINNWEKYILNSFTCPYTNGYTEGVNNKIKVLKRNAYGVRNFKRFRNRILHVMS
jgi:transposase